MSVFLAPFTQVVLADGTQRRADAVAEGDCLKGGATVLAAFPHPVRAPFSREQHAVPYALRGYDRPLQDGTGRIIVGGRSATQIQVSEDAPSRVALAGSPEFMPLRVSPGDEVPMIELRIQEGGHVVLASTTVVMALRNDSS